jgi:hypothetical protein
MNELPCTVVICCVQDWFLSITREQCFHGDIYGNSAREAAHLLQHLDYTSLLNVIMSKVSLSSVSKSILSMGNWTEYIIHFQCGKDIGICHDDGENIGTTMGCMLVAVLAVVLVYVSGCGYRSAGCMLVAMVTGVPGVC